MVYLLWHLSALLECGQQQCLYMYIRKTYEKGMTWKKALKQIMKGHNIKGYFSPLYGYTSPSQDIFCFLLGFQATC